MGLTEIDLLRRHTPQWQFEASENTLVRVFRFKDFHQTMDFVNQMAAIIHAEDHHPELQITYSQCRVSFNTHTVRGITENDFICAAKIDQLVES